MLPNMSSTLLLLFLVSWKHVHSAIIWDSHGLKNVQKETGGGGCEHLGDVVHHGDLELHVHECLVRVGDEVVKDMLEGNKGIAFNWFSCLDTLPLTTVIMKRRAYLI